MRRHDFKDSLFTHFAQLAGVTDERAGSYRLLQTEETHAANS